MVVVLVKLAVELRNVSYAQKASCHGAAYQVKNRHFHHTLVEICCPVLHHLYCDNFLRLQILALDHLAECALAKHIKDEIAIPGKLFSSCCREILLYYLLVACLLRTKNIVDI
jgi:hypothetical protein